MKFFYFKKIKFLDSECRHDFRFPVVVASQKWTKKNFCKNDILRLIHSSCSFCCINRWKPGFSFLSPRISKSDDVWDSFANFQKFAKNFDITYCEPGFFTFFPESADFAKNKTISKYLWICKNFGIYCCKSKFFSYFFTNRHVRRRFADFQMCAKISALIVANSDFLMFFHEFAYLATVCEHFEKLQQIRYTLIQTQFLLYFFTNCCIWRRLRTFCKFPKHCKNRNARDYFINFQ